MNRRYEQQRIDEIIGEAALALLQQAGPVTLRALVAQLQNMEKLANTSDRRKDIVLAINEVRMSAKSANVGLPHESREQEDKEHHTFLKALSSTNSRKH
ncbi:hypothetical protein [Candidatus Pantoea multigeneris]|uniref:Uncharacterized protein n=1 Tax=Candidatus Pantoea multigeneris TaxID=2608357 RepID=A0ABX0RIH3_9GAMM|nr:hypothetical protein [Pantoea multigeneris]NIF23943.1 hypothetical protein [Pantoea multigeneris]